MISLIKTLFAQIGHAYWNFTDFVRKNPLGAIGALIAIGLMSWLVVWAYQEEKLGFDGKTMWAWLDLLIVPVTLAIGGFLLQRSQSRSEQLVANNQQEERLLQDYLNTMRDLVLEKKLRQADPDESVGEDLRNIARSITLVTLRGLDTNNPDGHNRRRASLLRFLHETSLIQGNKPVIKLRKANLENAYARKMDLRKVNLKHVSLYRAYLGKADLTEAKLKDAYMVRANLVEADLTRADLTEADLRGADLRMAKLDNTILKNARYGRYRGRMTKWPAGFEPTARGAVRRD